MRTKRILWLTLFLIVFAMPAAAEELQQIPADTTQAEPVPAPPDRTYNVDCYLGNPNDGKNLGTLTVPSASDAGPACNATFFDCNGNCYGCITDLDNSCMNKSGEILSR